MRPTDVWMEALRVVRVVREIVNQVNQVVVVRSKEIGSLVRSHVNVLLF